RRLGPSDRAGGIRLRATEQDAVIEHVVEIEDEDVRCGRAAPTLRLPQIEKLFHPLAVERPGGEHARKRRAGEPQPRVELERLAVPFRVYDLAARDDQPPAHRPQTLPPLQRDGKRVLAQLDLHALTMLKPA